MPSSRTSGLLLSAVALLGGAFAGVLADAIRRPTPRHDQPHLHERDFELGRLIQVDDSKWWSLLELFADFDLQTTVELSENTDLDLLLRRTEPRTVQEQLPRFQGRFTVLRLSTRSGNATPWLSREQALLEPWRTGAPITAGVPATVLVQARGRWLRANVAGTWLPWIEATDDQGNMAFVSHGGNAVVRSLVLHNLGVPTRLPVWALAALAGLVLLAGGYARGLSRVRLACGLLLFPVATWAARADAFRQLLPLCEPDVASVLLCVLAGALLTVASWLRWSAPMRALVPGVLLLGGSVAAAGLAAAREAPRRADCEHPALELLFGPAAGDGLTEALAARLSGPFVKHTLAEAGQGVFLLGGKLLYAGRAPEQDLEVHLGGALACRKRGEIKVWSLPTADGYVEQQWWLFESFYTSYRPKVLVVGVPNDEGATVQRSRAAAWLRQQVLQHGLSFAAARRELLEDIRKAGDLAIGSWLTGGGGGSSEVVRSTPAELRQLLPHIRDWCAANSCRLVLLLDDHVAEPFREVVRAVAGGDVLLFETAAGEKVESIASRLAEQLVPLLH